MGICFVGGHVESRLGMARIDADRRQPFRCQRMIEPHRQGPGLEHHPSNVGRAAADHLGDEPRIGPAPAAPHALAVAADRHRRFLHRHVQTYILSHLCPPVPSAQARAIARRPRGTIMIGRAAVGSTPAPTPSDRRGDSLPRLPHVDAPALQRTKATAYANRYAYVPPAKPRAQRGPHTGEATCRRLRPREQWIAISVPALVDQEMWDRAQAQLARNAALSFRNNARHSYLLRCLLTCEVCGLAMYGVTRPATATKPERQYYECRGKDCVLSARTAACPSRHLKAEEIEPVVWDHVAGLLADPDRLLAQFDHLAATAEAGSARDQAAEQQLRARLDRTVRADKRLLDAYQAGAITLAELSERRQFLASERQALERQQEDQARLRQQRLRAEAVRMDLAAFCNRIHSRLDEATFADKQAILQLVIERIIVGNGRLEIRHVIPLRPPPQPSNNGPVQPIRRLRSDGVHPTALAARLGPDLLKGLPETECAVGHREFRPDRQPAPPEVEQQLPPGLHALAHAIGQAHDLLLAFRRRADDDQKALGVRFKAGLHMDAVDPEVDVAFGREIALRPPGMLVRPGVLQSGDARGG